MSRRSVVMVLGLALGGLAGPGDAGAAQEAAAGAAAHSPGVDAVLACRDLKKDKAQLACFRDAAERLAEESSRGAPATTASAPATPPAPQPFGAPPPRVRRDQPAEARAAVLVVRSIGDLGDGRAILNLADGSSWVETESEPITSAVKAGDKVRLEKGVLGGYLLVLPHRSAIRMRRLRTE